MAALAASEVLYLSRNADDMCIQLFQDVGLLSLYRRQAGPLALLTLCKR